MATLNMYTKARKPISLGQYLVCFGEAYRNRRYGANEDNLEQAILCFTSALRNLTKKQSPYDWARTQESLGKIYEVRQRGDFGENTKQAIRCYTSALRVLSEDPYPYAWAWIQHRLGEAFFIKQEMDKKNIERSLACHEAALRIVTEANSPVDHRTCALAYAAVLAHQQRGRRLTPFTWLQCVWKSATLQLNREC